MKILRSIRNNIFIVLFAALFSGMLIVSKHFVLRMDGAFSGHLKDVSIFDFHWFDVVAWLALTTLSSSFLIAVVSVLSKGLARGAARPQSDHAGTAPDSSQDAIPGGDPRRNKAGGTAFFLAVFALLLIAWLPYALTFVPFAVVVLGMADRRADLIHIVVLQTVAANLGSILTPVGNPQNLYLYSYYDLSFGDFIRATLPIWFLSLVLSAGRGKQQTSHCKKDVFHTICYKNYRNSAPNFSLKSRRSFSIMASTALSVKVLSGSWR